MLGGLNDYCHQKNYFRPILLKLSGDISENCLLRIPDLVKEYELTGVIACGPVNLLQKVDESTQQLIDPQKKGAICGHPIFKNSMRIVQQLRNMAGPDLLIIGAGGIISEEDAIQMKKAGADLIQIYSSFIYEGPFIAARMTKHLSSCFPKLFSE